jgi:hypothetical protein
MKMDARKAIDTLNDVIRALNVKIRNQNFNDDLVKQVDKLDDVRQFLGKDV